MAGVEKVCAVCGTVFRVPPCRAKSAKTCSMFCKGKIWTMVCAEALPQKKCKVCGSMFSYYPSHENRRHYCSPACGNKAKALSNGRPGALNANWKGGEAKHSDGYLYRAADGHPFVHCGNYVLDHRLVMESWMREEVPDHRFLVEVDGIKYLDPEIQVHHIDGNKRNNRRKNLLACTASSHLIMHSGRPPMCGEVWPEVIGQVPYEPLRVRRICEVCGGEFLKRRSDVARGGGKFCSRACYNSRPREIFKATTT